MLRSAPDEEDLKRLCAVARLIPDALGRREVMEGFFEGVTAGVAEADDAEGEVNR